MFLLLFVLIKRLVAVKHLSSFSMVTKRAKKYIIIIVGVATVYRTVSDVSTFMRYGMIIRISENRACMFLVHS